MVECWEYHQLYSLTLSHPPTAPTAFTPSYPLDLDIKEPILLKRLLHSADRGSINIALAMCLGGKRSSNSVAKCG